MDAKRNADRKNLLLMEVDVSKAIYAALSKYDDEGAYWYPDGLADDMARAAMHVLEVASAAAAWGKREI